MSRIKTSKKRAVVLLSGGLDSAVTLYFAVRKGYEPFCLIFDYGQRHSKEISAAKSVARSCGSDFSVVKISLPWKGSSLTDKKLKVPDEVKEGIPSTYVPARNIIFLSFALSCAEATGAEAIFIGAHAQDYSGYPDCRPQFYRAFKKVIKAGTKSGVENKKIEMVTPLIDKTKAQIIRLGKSLGVPFGLTWSCYRGKSKPCGKCDSCFYRAKGFREARLIDPGTR
ncbi:MAG: 7-cyano-7-deazaguanine synthase QueC [Candidatus Omnitrophica bacterium]|nr:7-cyano-7-deazaguanine synthase QueC [Candidatus Omnitrophota bacterium]